MLGKLERLRARGGRMELDSSGVYPFQFPNPSGCTGSDVLRKFDLLLATDSVDTLRPFMSLRHTPTALELRRKRVALTLPKAASR